MPEQVKTDYICPYCRWNKSNTWKHLQEEKELIDSKYIGQDLTKTYYLDTNRKFKVKICDRCHSALKIRSMVIMILITGFTVCILLGFAASFIDDIFTLPALGKIGEILMIVGFMLFMILALFWIMWKIFARTRAHVSYSRASECNALAPYSQNLF